MAFNRKPLVAGNWKMNGTYALIDQFTDYFSTKEKLPVDCVLCPPSVFLEKAIKDSEGIGWGVASQDVSYRKPGAHTGDLAAEMLVDIGCQMAIIGHSERRTDHNECDETIALKALRLLSVGITPIYCVGESLETRKLGQEQIFVKKQLDALFASLTTEQLEQVVIAYEPIWAIGTGVTASPEQAQEMHAFIRNLLSDRAESAAGKVRILYGGSVKASNARELFTQKDIDGGLVGGASLNPEEFEAICRAAVT